MAAIAERLYCDCRIVDYNITSSGNAAYINDLKNFKPDYLVISTTSPTLCDDLNACTIAKKYLPNIQTIAKGAHFLKFNTQVLEDFPDVDMIIHGEAETVFEKILSNIGKQKIAGLTWRDINKIRHNDEYPFIDDLDTLPFPSRHLIDNRRYVRMDNGKPQAVIKVSRGCPYNCFYCLASPVSGKKVRTRSPENIVEEIRTCIKKYGIHDFIFFSDIFTFNKHWVESLCDAILSSGLSFNWASNTRVDTIDLELAKLMRKSGCDLVSVGIESGCQKIRNKAGKSFTNDEIRAAFQVFKKAGLKTLAYYMIGLPWETRQTVAETIEFAIALDSDFANFFVATPFPGTQFFDYACKNDLLTTQNGCKKVRYNYFSNPTVKGHNLTRNEICDLQKRAVQQYVFRPRYIVKKVSKIKSWRELLNYSKFAMSLMN